jgi:hypothetical protein
MSLRSTSLIDKSLQDLDLLIEKKRAHLRHLDSIRKQRSPGSFILVANVAPTPSTTSAKKIGSNSKSFSTYAAPVSQKFGDIFADKENVHSNRLPIHSNNTLSMSKSPVKRMPMTVLGAHAANSNVTKDEFQSGLDLSIDIDDAKPQEPRHDGAPLHVVDAADHSEQNLNMSLAEADSQLVVDSMNAALKRIEELEHDRSDYASFIQRLDREKKELTNVLEAQKEVIDALNVERNSPAPVMMSTSGKSVQFEASSTASTDVSSMSSMPGARRRLVRRGTPAKKSTPSSSSSSSSRSSPATAPEDGEGEEPSPFLLAKLSPEAASPEAPVEHSTLADASPNSIFIIRQKVLPSPGIDNISSTYTSRRRGVLETVTTVGPFVETDSWTLEFAGGTVLGVLIALMLYLVFGRVSF